MPKRLVVTMVVAFTAVACFMASSVIAEKPRIAYPVDYRAKLENYVSLDRTQHHDQVIRLFASPRALRAAAAGEKLPNGTVLVAEVYKAKKDGAGNVLRSLGRRIRGEFVAVAVMEKRAGWGKRFPDKLRNGDWDFAIFSPTGKRLVKKDLDSCRSCHAPLKATDHVFSLEHMKRR